jgi:hypothetical protein
MGSDGNALAAPPPAATKTKGGDVWKRSSFHGMAAFTRGAVDRLDTLLEGEGPR